MSALRYVRSPLAVWRSTSMFLVATVPPEPPHTIMGSASLVWSALEEPVTIEEVIERIADAVTSVPQGIGADVAMLVDELVARRLVEVRP